jgi:hypothetical protein
MPSDQPISEILIGKNPITVDEASSLPTLSYSEFHQHIVRERKLPLHCLNGAAALLVFATGNCDKYLFDIKGRKTLFEEHNYAPMKRGYRWLLRDGLVYTMYKEALHARYDIKKLAIHIRIGDCWHATPQQIEDEVVTEIMQTAINSGHNFGKYNNVEDPSPHGRFSVSKVFIDAISNVTNEYGRHEEISVVSDGFSRLASELNLWALDNNRKIDFNTIEYALNQSYFSSFLTIDPPPKMLVGEQPNLLIPSLIELMLADTLVIGLSALPLALRCAYEIPVQRIFSVSKMYNSNIDFDSFGLSSQKL